MNVRATVFSCGFAVLALLTPNMATAYSTKLHMITAHHVAEMLKKNDCKIRLGGWNNRASGVDLRATIPGIPARQSTDQTYTVDLKGEICDLITNPATRQYFVAASTGPDTFPGMFGNTDPTHALLWNTTWQIAVLWQNAKTPEEKAFVLGWLAHFGGDINAHGLANLHASGVWMAEGNEDTVSRHIVTEMYYSFRWVTYPRGFDNTLKWPDKFVKRVFFNPESPIYKHLDYVWNRYANTPSIGIPAKVFGALFRALFLLWDYHAREMHRWAGRKEYFEPTMRKSLKNWLHWAYADQVWNWHKKKGRAARKSIDTWYEATHRAQQAVVADPVAVWDGKKKYDKVTETFGVDRVKKDYYKSAGFGGIFDAYKYLGSALGEQFTLDLITITTEQFYKTFPELRPVLDQLEKLGPAGVRIIEGLKQLAHAFVDVIMAPLVALKEAAFEIIEPLVNEFRYWVTNETYCTLMPRMCRSIDAQMRAFRVVPGNLNSYLNWPVYRNSITLTALFLEKMKTLDKEKGDETKGPTFGFPSGDFGCATACTGPFREHAALFMPMAGTYYQNRDIKRAFPDYCLGANTIDQRRADIVMNDVFAVRTNNEANKVADDPAFTCFGAGTGAKPASCGGLDNYAAAAPFLSFKGEPRGIKDRFEKLVGDFFQAIRGRWSYHTHEIPHERAVFVMPVDANLQREDVSRRGATRTVRRPPSQRSRHSEFGSLGRAVDSQTSIEEMPSRTTIQDFAKLKPNPVVYLERGGQASEMRHEKKTEAPVCYNALSYGEMTGVSPVPDPVDDHKGAKKVASYGLDYYTRNAGRDLKDVWEMGFDEIMRWLAKKACRWVEKKVEMGFEALLKDPALAACREGCRLGSYEAKMCKACTRQCALGVCATIGDCNARIACIPIVTFLDQAKYRRCVETQCKKIITTKVNICDN